MEMKRLIIGMIVAMAVVFAWKIGVEYAGQRWGLEEVPVVADNPPAPPADTQQAQPPSTAPQTTRPTTSEGSPGGETIRRSGLFAQGDESGGASHQLGSATPNDNRFTMSLTIAPGGAGIDQVILNQFRASADKKDPFIFQKPYPQAADVSRSLATRWLTINGQRVDTTWLKWRLEDSSDAQSATYVAQIIADNGPLLNVRKRFVLTERSDKADTSQGYEVLVTHEFENLTDTELKVSAVINGPNEPPQEMVSMDDRQIISGYYEPQRRNFELDYFAARTLDATSSSKDLILEAEEGYLLSWAGASSVYFNAIVRLLPAEGSKEPFTRFGAASVSLVDLNAAPENRLALITLATPELSVAPGSKSAISAAVFLGPKTRSLLHSSYYSHPALRYGETLNTQQGMCGACAFDWLIDGLVWMLRMFEKVLFDWGLAIIALVCVVRLLLHPITKKSTINMHKMAKLGPEMERLKKKYGDDKDELNKAMMQFYKEQGFTPILGCLPMFLQMPIWIALYTSLQSTFELRHAPFLHFGPLKLSWINDLSQPDRLLSWEPVPLLFGWTISALNVLPFLLAGVFWLQQKVTPKPPATSPQQEQQQKMMQWMTLLFPLFLYSAPSGLNLYILTSTTIGIIESKRIRKHITEKEEAEKNQQVIVDAKPTRGSKKARLESVASEAKAKAKTSPGGIRGWLADLQERAEQLRREQDKKKGR